LSAENATLREQIVALMAQRDTAQIHELDRAIRSSLIASAEEIRALRQAAKDIGFSTERLCREGERLTQFAPLPLEAKPRIVREPDPLTEERLKRVEAAYLKSLQEKEKLIRQFTDAVGHPPDEF
jgi:methylphosphotriester-DNA--protein-cysteine methyltransferase